jgi:hypothetical protein
MSGNYYGRVSHTRRTNSFAIAALVCGIVQFCFPPACFVAIVVGHKARRQIRRTGEDGYGLATAGLILGYCSLTLGLLALVIGLVMNAPVQPTLRNQPPVPPAGSRVIGPVTGPGVAAGTLGRPAQVELVEVRAAAQVLLEVGDLNRPWRVKILPHGAAGVV